MNTYRKLHTYFYLTLSKQFHTGDKRIHNRVNKSLFCLSLEMTANKSLFRTYRGENISP